MSRRSSAQGRKTLQLCRQVQEGLELALAGASNPDLQSFYILAVEPAPDASHLRVVVSGGAPSSLEAAKPWLRDEAAAAISRKRAPFLDWVIL
ncbi:hypothetical protein KKF91_06405 [Myxococcota bacterium]|nr:hypothetical protein [Myxococcota bacterium]MBU1430185.1 hypothetical protein [Myxococcota bacterium]MBU1898599.1 hypothetical protein [Myxococcota bacterium]